MEESDKMEAAESNNKHEGRFFVDVSFYFCSEMEEQTMCFKQKGF